MGPITTDIIDCDRDDDDVAIETERFVLEAEIASRESEHVIIANELRWLRKRLVQVEARLRRSDKRPTVCSDD